MTNSDLNGTIEGYNEALRDFMRGDAEPCASYFSDREDVTLANPLGPPQRGPAAVRQAMLAAAANFAQGGGYRFDDAAITFEEVSRFATPDLGYIVQLETSSGRLAGSDKPVVIELRATMVFRREEGVWKVVHRHADPITTVRPLSTAIRA